MNVMKFLGVCVGWIVSVVLAYGVLQRDVAVLQARVELAHQSQSETQRDIREMRRDLAELKLFLMSK